MKIGIIGSGICALTIGDFLKETKFEISFFEKSRGAGGRLCTRRKNVFQIDHGAQFFKASKKEFIDFLEKIDNSHIQTWEADFVEICPISKNFTQSYKWTKNSKNFVGVPSMSSFPKFLSKNLNLNLETKIEQIIKKNEKFFFLDQRSNQFGPFDFIILAIPPIQAIELLKNQNFSFNENLKNVKMSGCFSLMACFKEIPKNFKKTFDIALIKNPSVLSMICFNDSKPSRNKDQICITSLSKNSFADHHIEINSDSSEIKEILKLETSRILNFNLDNADLIDMQQFKFANIAKKNKEKALIDYENNIAVCGDWEFGGRVECAFLSGLRIANLLKKHFV